MVNAVDYQLIDFTFNCFIINVLKLLPLGAAMGADTGLLIISTLLNPIVQAKLTEVLSTAHGKLRLIQYLPADFAYEFAGYFLDKFILKIALCRNTSHCDCSQCMLQTMNSHSYK